MSRPAAPYRIFKPEKKYWHCRFTVFKDGKKVLIQRSTKAITRAAAEDGAKAWKAHFIRSFSNPEMSEGGAISVSQLCLFE